MRFVWLPGFIITVVAACGADPTGADRLYGMPARDGAPHTASVPPTMLATGGPVFVALTAAPTPEALRALERAGLDPAAGEPALKVWPSIGVVHAQLRAGRLRSVANLRFVRAIEPVPPPDRLRGP